MDFEFSPSQEEMRATVRRFFAEQSPLSYVRGLLDEPAPAKDDVWRDLCALGAAGILAPESAGGDGLGMVEMGVVLEEAGRALYPGPVLSSAVGAVSLAGALGAADLAAGLASGELTGTVALLEPGRGNRWEEPLVSASTSGRLSGEKTMVADAASADVILVAASVNGSGPAVFAVDRGAAGLTVEPSPTVDGTRKSATVRLDGAPGRRLDDGAEAARAALSTTVDLLLIGMSVDGVGAAARALELAVDYAKVRQQFGRPIGSFQAVQHLCADMLRAVELARAGAYYALWAASSGDAAERHRAATMAKAYAGEWLPGVGAATIQVFGGVGFTWEHDAHLYYKRLLSLQQMLGTPAQHLEELARIVLGAGRPPATG